MAELVKNNHLTPFQAQQVKAGKAKSLILGEYTILDKIGAGGMGQVFKAQHRRMERIVAIKMLPPAMTKDAASMARFEREVRAAAKLRHPNIVAADDAGQAGDAHFLVMEYVDGKDLSAMVKKDGPFPVNKAVNYILQAARGLEFAHGEGRGSPRHQARQLAARQRRQSSRFSTWAWPVSSQMVALPKPN